MARVLHLAYDHASDDVRIRRREIDTLIAEGYDVSILASSDNIALSDREGVCDDGCNVIGYTVSPSFGIRPLFFIGLKDRLNDRRIIEKLIHDNRPDVVHIHEVSFLPVVGYIKKFMPETKVIYDVHEYTVQSYYEDQLTKVRVTAPLMYILVDYIEKHYVRMVDAVVIATPQMRKRFERLCRNVTEFRNFPMDIEPVSNRDYDDNEAIACYVGGMSENRGITTLCSIADRIHGNIVLAGWAEDEYLEKIRSMIATKSNISYVGCLDRKGVNELLSRSVVGLCTLKFSSHHAEAYPVKIFEYMAAGVPVVSSDFPVYKEFVERNNCGITVDPDDEDAIVDAVNTIMDDRQKAREYGTNGIRAIKDSYSFENERIRLIQLYKRLLDR